MLRSPNIMNLKMIVRGFLSQDCDFELRADRHPTSEEWDLIFETLMISRRQSDRKRDAEQKQRAAPENGAESVDKTQPEANALGPTPEDSKADSQEVKG